MNLFVSYFLLYIFALAYGNENEDRKILSASRSKSKGIVDYEAKHDNRMRALEKKFSIHELDQDTQIREFEQKFSIRELEHDTRVREFEQKFWIREIKQDTRIRELELDIRNYKLNQAKRIRKLEHAIQIQSKQIGDLIDDCTYSKKDNVQVNDKLVLSDMNATVSKMPEIKAKEADSSELNNVRTRRDGKTENMEIMSDRKRHLLSIQNTNPSNMVTFYAYMNTHETNPGRHQTLIFDDVKINLGSGYSQNSGLFTTPGHGIYVFSWTVVADEYGFVYSEIVINSTPYGSILSNSQDVRDFHTVTGIVVAEVNKGDEIYIRTNPNYPIKGRIVSDLSLRTSFSGWKIADI